MGRCDEELIGSFKEKVGRRDDDFALMKEGPSSKFGH